MQICSHSALVEWVSMVSGHGWTAPAPGPAHCEAGREGGRGQQRRLTMPD